MKKLSLLLLLLSVLAVSCNRSQPAPPNNQTQTQENASQPPSQPAPDQPVNWKTYTNTKYGYSFNYPEELKPINNNPSSDDIFFDSVRGHLSINIKEGKINPANFETIGGAPATKITVGGKVAYDDFSGDAGCEANLIGVDLSSKTMIINFNDCGETARPLASDKNLISQVLSTFQFTVTPKSAQQVKNGQRKAYSNPSFGINFVYNTEEYMAPQIIQEGNPSYNYKKMSEIILKDNTFPPDFATATGSIRIYKETGRPANFIDQELNSLPKNNFANGGCQVISKAPVNGQATIDYQCAGLGDTETVLIQHPDGSFIRIEGVFAGDGYRELVNSIKFTT